MPKRAARKAEPELSTFTVRVTERASGAQVVLTDIQAATIAAATEQIEQIGYDPNAYTVTIAPKRATED